MTKPEKTETQKAEALCAQMELMKQQFRREVEARERREHLATMVRQLDDIKAAGERLRRERTRAARTARFGPYLFG